MSGVDILHLNLNKQHLNKLANGKSFQLSAEQLKSALSGDANAELHMLKKHISAIGRAHNNGKGVRIQHKHVVGGRLSFGKTMRHVKETGQKAIHGIQKAMKNKAVKDTVKALGHIATNTLDTMAKQQGYDTSAYADIANRAIENKKGVRKDIANQLSNDIINQAQEASHRTTGGKLSKTAKAFADTMKHIGNNPIVQNVASNVIADALMGAGKRKKKGGALYTAGSGLGPRPAKGSPEMKEYMAKLRSMRKKGKK